MTEDFPENICNMCHSLLRIAQQFQTQFKHSQDTLRIKCNASPVKSLENFNIKCEETEEEKAPVELIFSGQSCSITDLLIVEDCEEEKSDFSGFIQNLGKEVSVNFVSNEKPENTFIDDPEMIIIEPIDEEKVLSEHKEEIKKEVKTSEKPKRKSKKLKKVEENKCDPKHQRCKECRLSFRNQTELTDHSSYCQGPPVKPYICENCGHISFTLSAFNHHRKNHQKHRFKCHLCPKQYITTSRLKTHMVVHENLRKFLCSVCGKNFNYRNALQYHMRLHTGEKPYVCNYCGLRFHMDGACKRHMRNHTNEKPYECQFCLKKFASGSEKREHENMHTGHTPYHCAYCGKGFRKVWNMKIHCLSHDGPHQCCLCSKSFVEKEFLDMHCKRSHSFNRDDLE